MANSEYWDRDAPQWYNLQDLRPEPLNTGPRTLHGQQGRLLSRYRNEPDGSATYQVTVAPGWRAVDRSEAFVEIFVTTGSIVAGGVRLGPGGFVAIPRGSGDVEMSSAAGADLIVFYNPQLESGACYPDGKVRIRNVFEEEWTRYDIPNIPSGQLIKSLRDPDSNLGKVHGGEAGMVRLFHLPPGFRIPDAENHGDAWEEMIFFSGDLVMGERGFGQAGTVLENPPWFQHGPFGTQRGCFMILQVLERHDTNRMHTEGGPEYVDDYLRTEAHFAPPAGATAMTVPAPRGA